MDPPTASAVGLQRNDKELLAVAASLAAGCIPCPRHHAVAVRDAGASEAEVGWTAVVGIAVERRSLDIVRAVAGELVNLPDSASDAAPEPGRGESRSSCARVMPSSTAGAQWAAAASVTSGANRDQLRGEWR